jgi:uncharacterized protein (TIGR02145 family)
MEIMRYFSVFVIMFCWLINVDAQNITITDDAGYEADSSAMLDVKSDTKGLLIPRMTSLQRENIVNPADGLLVFDTDVQGFYYCSGSVWYNLSSSELWSENGSTISPTSSSSNVGVGTNDAQNKLIVKGDYDENPDAAIFAVVNEAGDTLFAVYPEGTRVFVDNSVTKATGNRGGFAVGGFTTVKGNEEEYLRVTPDSVRVYIKDEPDNKLNATGSRGGFAVGGFTTVKAGSDSSFYFFTDEIGTQVTFLTGDQRDAITEPEEGSIIFNTSDSCLQVFLGIWESIWCTSLNCSEPIILAQPSDTYGQAPGNATFTTYSGGNRLNFVWQLSTDGGSSWNAIGDGGPGPTYDGANNDTLYISNLNISHEGYMYRCYVYNTCGDATTESGTLYGCGLPLVDERDSKSYNTTLIGDQCWMAENLNVGTMDYSVANDGAIQKYCYDNLETNCDTWGALYDWDEMMDYNGADDGNPGTTQGICPTGWHIPTNSEWDELIDYVGGPTIAARYLKQTGTSTWYGTTAGTNNSTGFTAIPAGARQNVSSFMDMNFYARFRTASAIYGNYFMYYNNDEVDYHNGYSNDWSVRCLRD